MLRLLARSHTHTQFISTKQTLDAIIYFLGKMSGVEATFVPDVKTEIIFAKQT